MAFFSLKLPEVCCKCVVFLVDFAAVRIRKILVDHWITISGAGLAVTTEFQSASVAPHAYLIAESDGQSQLRSSALLPGRAVIGVEKVRQPLRQRMVTLVRTYVGAAQGVTEAAATGHPAAVHYVVRACDS